MNRKRQESYVYILTNFKRNVLYVGVTSHLEKSFGPNVVNFLSWFLHLQKIRDSTMVFQSSLFDQSKQIGHGDLWTPLASLAGDDDGEQALARLFVRGFVFRRIVPRRID